MKYENYQRNHVIVPGREDALTWSCFDTLENLPHLNKTEALDEILYDSYAGNSPISFCERGLTNNDVLI
jgi:hypothetical protein